MASENITNQLQKEIKSLGDMLEEVIDTTKDKNQSELETLRAKAESILQNSRKTLADSGELLLNQTKEIATKTDNYVHEKPWNGIGIAAAIGVMVGVLLSRR